MFVNLIFKEYYIKYPFNPDNQMTSANKTVASYKSGHRFITVGHKAFEHYLKFQKKDGLMSFLSW